MKVHRRMIVLATILLMATVFTLGLVRVFAHEAMLNIDLDSCIAVREGDGTDELWYALEKDAECHHIDHNTLLIEYYFMPNSLDDTYGWDFPHGITEGDIVTIQNAYAESMKKWNMVYFYTYDSKGRINKNSIIFVVEAAIQENANLLIYPHAFTGFDFGILASTYAEEGTDTEIETGSITHTHYSQWRMKVDPIWFYQSLWCEDLVEKYSNISVADLLDFTQGGVGAHELGHILGLRDVNEYCGDHHAELLMGYYEQDENDLTQIILPSADITYKDIAGVAITRGFHTDDDHKWLNAGLQSDGQYKLICSVCNGVLRVDSLSGYTYDTYGSCNENHDLSSGNMMAVASYGTKDYYKCRYCRYVAPFENNVEQDYVVDEYVDATQHTVVNNVTGLAYTTYAHHDYHFNFVDNATHRGLCLCGYAVTEAHWVKRSELIDNRYGVCLDCDTLIDLGGGLAEVGPFSTAKISANGSYLLPSGVAVIADADVEAYLNGTLVFYDPADLPVIQ